MPEHQYWCPFGVHFELDQAALNSGLPEQFGLEPAVGIEPTTDGLQNRCSTTELRWRCEESKSAIPQIVNEPFCIPWLRNWTGRPGSESQNPPRISVLKLDDFAPVIVGV